MIFRQLRVLGVLFLLVVLFSAVVGAQPPQWLKGSTDEQLKALADIQPGLGTVMVEYAGRFSTMYYAAKGGNWDLADYQLKEMREIQEVGETTRPGRAAALKTFEQAFLDPLAKTIKAKSWSRFNTAFTNTAIGCNGCHASQNFAFIKYHVPAGPGFPWLTMTKPQ